MTTHDEAEVERDRQLADELHQLAKEREDILKSTFHDSCPIFRDHQIHIKRRIRIAADYRDLQLANLKADLDVEVQQAWNEFERAKRVLRAEMLAVSVDRRRRLDSIRTSTIVKKKKKGKTFNTLPDRVTKFRKETRHPFLASLERQGMVRVSLTPDEVNNDLACILGAMDSVKNPSQRPSSERPAETSTKTVDKIHSSRGILHYHDNTYEKGDRIAILAHGKSSPSNPLSLKYSGSLLSINAKEVQIMSDAGKITSIVSSET